MCNHLWRLWFAMVLCGPFYLGFATYLPWLAPYGMAALWLWAIGAIGWSITWIACDLQSLRRPKPADH